MLQESATQQFNLIAPPCPSEPTTNLENLSFQPIIAPPPQFQDPPPIVVLQKFAERLVRLLLQDAMNVSSSATWSIPCSHVCHSIEDLPPSRPLSAGTTASAARLRLCWTPEMHPCHSRLSASHDSLSVPVDDSLFITSAISQDALLSDDYTVPVGNDVYAVPVDHCHDKKRTTGERRRRRLTGKVTSRSASASNSHTEPIHLTLQEVRQYLQNLYSNNKNDSNNEKNIKQFNDTLKRLHNPFKGSGNHGSPRHEKYYLNNTQHVPRRIGDHKSYSTNRKTAKSSFPSAIKQTLCSLFRFRKLPCTTTQSDASASRTMRRYRSSDEIGLRLSGYEEQNPPSSPITKAPQRVVGLPLVPLLPAPPVPPPLPQRALPPLPRSQSRVQGGGGGGDERVSVMDFVQSIQKVKDYGWYWGPISGEAAERILSNEPDGSFIVRDSSDDYYIFSLTFKLNSIIRHVRIEHDQGNFSFGNTTRFKSHTIVDFIESAVEHSRSGRYLFFLHRRPVLGPMRVQLLHPVSRFKQVQSLQHMCRFVILKFVRRDLVDELPLPRRLLDYLSTPHYYAEHAIEEDPSTTEASTDVSEPSNPSSPRPVAPISS